MKNNKGFSKFEFSVGLVTVMILMVIGLKLVFNHKDTGDYMSMKKLADSFVMNVSVYKDDNYRADGMYYLFYLNDNGFIGNVNSPFSSNECDNYESYVNVHSPKKVSLKCDHYLLEGTYQDTYTVYEVSDWQAEEEVVGEAEIMYNYKKDGKEVNEEYLLEGAFVELYNTQEGGAYKTITEIHANQPENIELLSKVFYREKKIVKEYK